MYVRTYKIRIPTSSNQHRIKVLKNISACFEKFRPEVPLEKKKIKKRKIPSNEAAGIVLVIEIQLALW